MIDNSAARPRAWSSVLLSASFLFIAATASAQSRIEDSVHWADGTPAAAIAISVPELTLETTTDATGRFAFADVRPGIRITVNAFLDKRLLGRAYTLVTLWVERVEIQLAGTPSNPTPAPVVPLDLTRPVTPATAARSASAGSGTDTVVYDANGMPVVSSEVTVVADLPMLSASIEAGKVTLEPEQVTALVSTDSGPAPPDRSGRFATIFNSQPVSGFDDSNGRFDWQPTTRDQLSVSTYLEHDDVDNSRDLQLPTQFLEQIAARGRSFSGDFEITDVREYRNTGLSVRWNRDWSHLFRTSLTVGRSDYDTISQRSSNVGGRQGGSGELNVVDDTTVTISAPVSFNASNELTLGAQRTANRVVFEFANNLAGTTGPNGAQIGALASQLNRSTTGTTTSAFVQHRMMLGSRLIAMPGLRVTQSSMSDERYIEPRLTATWLATDRLRVKGAWGQYHQFVNRLVREDVFQGNREFWAVSDNTTVPVAASTNASVGAAYQTTRLLLDVEAFSRDITNLSQLAPRLRHRLHLDDHDGDCFCDGPTDIQRHSGRAWAALLLFHRAVNTNCVGHPGTTPGRRWDGVRGNVGTGFGCAERHWLRDAARSRGRNVWRAPY